MNASAPSSAPLEGSIPTHPSRGFDRGQLLFLALYVAFLIVPGRLFEALDAGAGPRAWTGILRYVLLAGLGIWVFRDAIARSWTLTRERPVRTGLLVIAAVLAAEIAPIIPAVLLSALGWMPEAGTNDANVSVLTDQVPALVFVITVALLGPLTEEFVFREALVQRARRWVPVWTCVLISSLAFGALHIHTLAELPLVLLYASIALVYALALLISRGNLLVPIIAHVIHNGVPALSAFLGQ